MDDHHQGVGMFGPITFGDVQAVGAGGTVEAEIVEPATMGSAGFQGV